MPTPSSTLRVAPQSSDSTGVAVAVVIVVIVIAVLVAVGVVVVILLVLRRKKTAMMTFYDGENNPNDITNPTYASGNKLESCGIMLYMLYNTCRS